MHGFRKRILHGATAMALAGLAWIVTGTGLLLETLGIHIAKPERFCVDMALGAGHLGWAGGAALDAVTAAASAVTISVVLRVFLAAYRFWQRSREHAHTARLLGAPTDWAETVVLTSPAATAYCVAGRPDAIVVTTGALAALSDAELAAVLTHEQAHLRGRHPQLLILFRALATSMPRLPLFTRGFEHVGRLLEMRADDIAAPRPAGAARRATPARRRISRGRNRGGSRRDRGARASRPPGGPRRGSRTIARADRADRDPGRADRGTHRHHKDLPPLDG